MIKKDHADGGPFRRRLTTSTLGVDYFWTPIMAYFSVPIDKKNVATAKRAPEGAGDIWTWVGLDADTKLVASFYVGGRDGDAAIEFMDDLAKRLTNRVQLTSDGHKAYLEAVEGAFGGDIDYAQIVKLYGPSPESATLRGATARPNALASKRRRSKASPIRSISARHFQRGKISTSAWATAA